LREEILNEVCERVNKFSDGVNAINSDFEVVFKNKDADKITINKKISFSINSVNSFKAKNSFDSYFQSKTYADISSVNIDNNKLIDIFNNYETGTNFESIKSSLENEIKKEYKDSIDGFDSKYLHFE